MRQSKLAKLLSQTPCFKVRKRLYNTKFEPTKYCRINCNQGALVALLFKLTFFVVSPHISAIYNLLSAALLVRISVFMEPNFVLFIGDTARIITKNHKKRSATPH
jgi:hypothetical protein